MLQRRVTFHVPGRWDGVQRDSSTCPPGGGGAAEITGVRLPSAPAAASMTKSPLPLLSDPPQASSLPQQAPKVLQVDGPRHSGTGSTPELVRVRLLVPRRSGSAKTETRRATEREGETGQELFADFTWVGGLGRF